VGAACAAEPAAPYHVGGTCRVFHPQVERHWRGARTEALVTNIWYPVDASVPETTRNIGEPVGQHFAAIHRPVKRRWRPPTPPTRC